MTLSKSSPDTHRLTTDEEARAALISSDPGQSFILTWIKFRANFRQQEPLPSPSIAPHPLGPHSKEQAKLKPQPPPSPARQMTDLTKDQAFHQKEYLLAIVPAHHTMSVK